VPLVRTSLTSAPDSLGIKLSSTNSGALGELVHTHDMAYTDSTFDEIHLFAYNDHSSSVTVSLQWGGVTSPDNVIDILVQSKSFLKIVDGLQISGKKSVSATADVANKVVLYGYAYAHVPLVSKHWPEPVANEVDGLWAGPPPAMLRGTVRSLKKIVSLYDAGVIDLKGLKMRVKQWWGK